MSSKHTPNQSSQSPATRPSQQGHQKKVPADLITYRLASEMVYVEPAQNFEQALDHAQAVYPQLADVQRSRIAFSVNVRVNGALRTVRIAPMAWPRVLRSLATYEIIDLSILPDLSDSPRAMSDLGLATSSRNSIATMVADEMPPPKYGSANSLGVDLFGPAPDATNVLRDPGKSLYYAAQQARETQPQPSSPEMNRCSSALSWFSKRL